MAFSAYKFASDDRTGGGGGSESGGGSAQEAASGILSMEFGGIVLGLLGIAFFVTAIFQAKKGITGEFMHRIAGDAPDATRWLGGAGFLARGVVYAVIGWSLVQAGFLSGGSDEVVTLGDAVASLADQGFVFTLVAIGLLLFGLFSLVLSRYRIIPELDSSKGIPKFRV